MTDFDIQIKQQENFLQTLSDAANSGRTNIDLGFKKTVQNVREKIASLKEQQAVEIQEALTILEPEENPIIEQKPQNNLLIPAIIIGALLLL